MFFTEEDYRKIEKWLVSKGIMDTQFSPATTLDGNETIAIVQNGKNVNTTIDALVEKLFLLGVDDFLNITDKYNQPAISLIQAISLIPFRHRKIGQVITFLNEDNKWVIYQFQGSSLIQWNNTTQWINVIGSAITGELVPDEEDLTGIKEGDKTVLKFKNKSYNTANFSGLGRVYLRKNITEDRNILTQQMINQENTRYILQYDYDLNGQTITIPANCVIEFEGGSISNGNIQGNSTIIVSPSRRIFGDTTTLIGNWSIDCIYPEWFGAIADGIQDSSTAISHCIKMAQGSSSGMTVKFGNGIYLVKAPIELSNLSVVKIEGEDKLISTIAGENIDYIFKFEDNDINRYFSFSNISLDGKNKTLHGIYSTKLARSRFENIRFTNFSKEALHIEYGWSNNINKCEFTNNNIGIYLSNQCYINNITETTIEGSNIGVYINNSAKCNINKCTLQSNSGTAVYSRFANTSLSITKNHFESNAEEGITFTNGETVVKADIILNGSTNPETLSSAWTNQDVTISDNYCISNKNNSFIFASALQSSTITTNFSRHIDNPFGPVNLITTYLDTNRCNISNIDISKNYGFNLPIFPEYVLWNTPNRFPDLSDISIDNTGLYNFANTNYSDWIQNYSDSPTNNYSVKLSDNKYKGNVISITGNPVGWRGFRFDLEKHPELQNKLLYLYCKVKSLNASTIFNLRMSTGNTNYVTQNKPLVVNSWAEQVLCYKTPDSGILLISFDVSSKGSGIGAIELTDLILSEVGNNKNLFEGEYQFINQDGTLVDKVVIIQ